MININFPQHFTSGDTVTFESELSDYSNNKYKLGFVILGKDTVINVIANPFTNDNAWKTTISYVDSSVDHGFYRWQAILTSIFTPYTRETIASGNVQILSNLSQINPQTYDPRSKYQITLDAIEQAIEDIANGGLIKEEEVEGRRLDLYSIDELLKLQTKYLQFVDIQKEAERRVLGKASSQNIRVRFV